MAARRRADQAAPSIPGGDHMFKRLIVLVAMAAALVACSPSGTASSPATETLAPVESGLPSEMPSESASPS
jgi:predicted small lipoprotein YifL